ncbi:MAG TPA: PLP-dependent aminotransferase family protein [Accumulibacter sp.]|uniref:aminotransferase-like domain-containing protein n=1 Tax=Accumulibacter sp. TaxID=2053492 RepID=UPI002BB49AD5|nr:PLP-dependent aminotransferase family protein [Accumulibacter sp.]HMW64189.1 PLP-dependent aminotransferase family protein [Accumulibacter sp.]HND37799.1 PLP-dependent aminotransferase family protein [Accumulibacter sp.]HNG86820.1 PLP-dependent aminotransferase family protein [Accumulibacter sp.]HNH92918.1 PLP-dependent aminotransferase family protein [Accumulibacter sp.]HNJ49296.1 PLP-dependent aminotransferase family protein [Accumulibacter sp.]
MESELLRYERLAEDLSGIISSGNLRPGERLPSIRRLSRDRRLSVSTVVQALRHLEQRGLIEARPQAGYFVRHVAPRRASPAARPTPVEPVPVDVSQRLIRVLLGGVQPGVAPLSAAMPASSLLPVAALQRLYSSVVRRHARLLEGHSHIHMDDPRLVRQLVLRSMGWAGPLAANEFVITNSCTEALGLCLRAVTRPGDTVAVESPGYYLMLQLLEVLGLRALEIPTDPHTGMSVEALDLATRQGNVTACLLVPNASNPLGSIMPDENKRRLARLTAERGVAVIEDDVYGDLYFGNERPWPVKAFDQTGNVMLCSSFSKCLSPALRVGFVAGGRYRAQLALHKTITSGATNPISQLVLAEYLESSACERHLRALRRTYERQVDAMRAAIARHFPAATRLTEPQGGFVLWIELPEEIDATALYERALATGVAYVPGELFSASGMYRNCLRLNCGNPHTPEIEDAVRRLGRLIGG